MPRPASVPLATRATRDPGWRRDALVLAVAAVLVRLPALLSARHLGFDDGVYGSSVVAMRHGGAPFRDVFSSQGPLHLPLLYVFDLLGLRTLDAPRLATVAAGVVVTLAVYTAARELTDRTGALLAAGLALTSGTLLWTTGPITSDGIAEAFGSLAVAVALGYRRSPSPGRAVAIGLLAGAAVSTKSLLVGPAVVVAWLLVLAGRRRLHAVLVPGIAAALLLALALPWGLRDVYDQSVRYHLDKTGRRDPLANARKTASTFGDRDLPILVAGALALLFGWRRRRDGGDRRAPGAAPRSGGSGVPDRLTEGSRPIALWLVLVIAVVVLQDPMWRNHMAHLIPPAALLVGVHRPPWRALAIAAIVVVPYALVHLRPVIWPEPYRGRAATVVQALRDLPEGAWAISDEPGLVWRAGRRTPAHLVDASRLRIEADAESLRVTPRVVAAAAAEPQVCALVVWSERYSGHRWRDHEMEPELAERYRAFEDDLPGLLAGAGYEVARRWDAEHVLYLKPGCDPSTSAAAAGPGDRAPGAARPLRSPG
ncbi:MAG: glycosyltransferase family 39 protein [Acidimicrobiia bacterium]|nr:glycosyltransferase family 39 protein [Acidimicrobiia bacterium]